ncbi:MAG: hypothetical protein L3K10_02625 [Thermoplasmata archaeon]|nr:hypothetical protein [Thermoplasmata archaeon]
MAGRPHRTRASPLLLVILLAALAVGAAVSLLVSARTAGPPPPVGPTSEVILPSWVVSVAILGFALAIIGPVLYFRIRYASNDVPGRFVVIATALILSMVIFVVITRLIHPTGGLSLVSGGNTTSPGGGTTPVPNGTLPPAGGPGGVLAPFNLPPWAVFVALVLAIVGVTVVGFPRLSEYLQDRQEARWARRRADQVATRVQKALRDAARDLGAGLDPRATILALYATLLVRIGPLATDLDRATPEEIRALHLTRLGIRPTAAEDLTRVFEEARYSSHPLGPPAVLRASEAIREAEDDLRRAGAVP